MQISDDDDDDGDRLCARGIYFASAVVATEFRQLTASSSASVTTYDVRSQRGACAAPHGVPRGAAGQRSFPANEKSGWALGTVCCSSDSEVTTLWRYTNLFIIIIIFLYPR